MVEAAPLQADAEMVTGVLAAVKVAGATGILVNVGAGHGQPPAGRVSVLDQVLFSNHPLLLRVRSKV